jgi:hypothetical protein
MLTDNCPRAPLPKGSMFQIVSLAPTGNSAVIHDGIPASTMIPTRSPSHPLCMEWLRQQDYPASEIVIEEVLERGTNYQRMIASYQSEG